ncbi:helix-turn-helix transcriptional regulator [Paenibacillus sp. JDR-2]|uniref:helix-turn-helix transcriptional regulator n=1 Tax=Paenibacillus sp. (strain JDR-2) TaxID=324057 RepID=UPI0001663E83|nr:AraC family transcriptional regulator [Paenibacillus sp. JDR-2]ACT02917.1 transcriptional regulator, AraC family [Paenibacillus sp. JDR-2]
MGHPMIQSDNLDLKILLGKLVLNVLYIKSGYFYRSMPEHRHSNGSYELHYIPSGQGRLIAEGKEFPLSPGSLYMTGPCVDHEQITDSSDPMFEYCIFFEALPSGRTNHGKLNGRSGCDSEDTSEIARLFLNTPFWIGQDSQQLQLVFEKLAWEINTRAIGYRRSITIQLEHIVIGLVRNYTNNQPTLQTAPLKTLDDKRMVLIENSILYNYKHITITTLADQLGLSIRQTERAVRKQYGMSLREKLQEARMQEAARLLDASLLTIGEIAVQVGYHSSESFATHFKKWHGATPSAYRVRVQDHVPSLPVRDAISR